MSEAGEQAVQLDLAAGWIVAIAQGDRRSFIALFHRFAPKVKSYLLRLGVSEAVAEELAQETFLLIWRKAYQFDPQRATAGAWIYTIARHLRVDHIRRERQPAAGCVDQAPEASRSPEDELTDEQSDARIRAAMAGLPREQSVVLHMSFFEEKTHPQIAEDLALPLGTVKSRIRLASAYLRSVLKIPT